MKQLSLIFILSGLLLTACNVKKQALSRQNLKMPALVNFEEFKRKLPVKDLRDFRRPDSGMQAFKYFFVIDSTGNVVDGNLDKSEDPNFNSLKKYIEGSFSHYKWHPAYYKFNVSEKLRTVLSLSIYDVPDKNVFEIAVRLEYIQGKEKLDDIFEEKNLIYKVKIR